MKPSGWDQRSSEVHVLRALWPAGKGACPWAVLWVSPSVWKAGQLSALFWRLPTTRQHTYVGPAWDSIGLCGVLSFAQIPVAPSLGNTAYLKTDYSNFLFYR